MLRAVYSVEVSLVDKNHRNSMLELKESVCGIDILGISTSITGLGGNQCLTYK